MLRIESSEKIKSIRIEWHVKPMRKGNVTMLIKKKRID